MAVGKEKRDEVYSRGKTGEEKGRLIKLLKRLAVSQAVPEIHLSVGSKLELYFSEVLSLPNFRILTHLSAYAYCLVYYYDTHQYRCKKDGERKTED